MPPAARVTDMHTCPMVTGIVPHVGGPIMPPGCPTVLIGFLPAARVSDLAVCVGPPDSIVMGSPTVLIGNLMAARLGDPTAHGGVIVFGCPTVMIGNSGGGGGAGGAVAGAAAGAAAAPTFGPGIVLEGSPAEQATLAAILNNIRNSGPQGAALIHGLETAPTPTHFRIGTSSTDRHGRVVQLANTGGGITLRPTDSVSGHNEIYVDPAHLITYNGTDGNTHTETPDGLVLHEAGHASLLNSRDPAQTTGGPQAEQNVRTLTNPVRTEMGQVPER
ncbi:MAG: PAAR domain-containing protein [Acidobacteriia bacterium]|nr:PAAR domain-containing protein [Terriglobia bacterium]